VAWITERKNVLSLFFSLLALAVPGPVRGKARPASMAFYGLAYIAYPFGALQAKTPPATLPVAMLLLLLGEIKTDRCATTWRQVAPFFFSYGISMGC